MKNRYKIILGSVVVMFVAVFSVTYVGSFPVIDNPTPPRGQAVEWNVELSHPYVEMNSDGEVYLNMKITGLDIPVLTDRPALNIVLVIDRSGSMSEKGKLDYAKEAAVNIINKLGSGDRIGIVAYSDNAELIYPIQFLEDKQGAITAVRALYPTNSTNLSAGLKRGINQLKGLRSENFIDRVILLSDGLANRGITNPSMLSKIARDASNAGIGITTMGLGLQFDENLMMSLAEHGAGNYYFIESPKQLASIFKMEFGRLATTVAKNPVISLDLAEGIIVREVFGYEYTVDKRKLTIKTGDIYGGQARNVMVRLKVPTSKPGKQALARATYAYYDVDGGRDVSKIVKEVSYIISEDKKTVALNKDKKVLAKSVSKRAAKTLSLASADYENGRRDNAISKLEDALSIVTELNNTPEQDQTTLRQEKELKGALDQIRNAAPAPSSEEGKQFLKQNKYRARELQK